MKPSRSTALATAALSITLLTPSIAFAWGEGPGENANPPGDHAEGSASGSELGAAVSRSRIVVKQTGGGTAKPSSGALAAIDPNWKPPACWYEPLATPQQLKGATEKMKKGDLFSVNFGRRWGKSLLVDAFDKGEPTFTDTPTKNYNVGKKGMFWRAVAREDRADDPEILDCSENLFWQDAGTLPDDPNAPTPETLAEYAYNKIRVPETEIELKPQAKSTVNMPTWAWLDKAVFKDVTVRADLPNTPLYAVTTAKPVALHLEPGTPDAKTFPASGDCPVNEDGSIGAPYTKGSSKQDPPCGIAYLRATNGKPYQLKASVTWEISWQGTGGAKGDLPDGKFETTQDMNVQEIQSINR
ncbi:hypothetical protein [Streptomyces sp. BA2]|uniref:hypothetical protein n=1 Tax=Streptomyces sp. BA2 TaxID=436595 RepID=UPI00132356AF|nr:hypothetical protein [Streptomyces sp. BA2]